MRNRNEKQVELFRRMADIYMKMIIAGAVLLTSLVAFGVLIYKVCVDSPWQNNVILGAIDGLLALSWPKIVKHFFPDRNSES